VNKTLKTLGNAAVVLSLLFLGVKFVALDIDKTLFLRADNTLHILWISFLFGLHLFVLCIPWKTFIRIITGREIPFFEAAWVLNRSNLMKYLPGNVFQFIGRNELAVRLDLPHADVACATVCDMALLVGTNCLMAAFLNWRGMEKWFGKYGFSGLYSFGILIAVMGVIFVFLRLGRGADILSKFAARLRIFFTWRSVRVILACMIWFVLLSLFVGVLFLAACTKILHVDVALRTVPTILSAYMLSWVAGFIVPGAPGGIGVREATLTLLLAGVVADEDALLAAIIFRLVTTIGDLWGLLFAWLGMGYSLKNKT
jgi:hypothetical protein